MWKDHNKWCCGSFMSSYTNIYRKWGQSWPKYRKSLTASIKQLSIGSYKSERNESSEEGILDDVDINELEDQNNSNIPSWLKICYLDKGYFKRPDFRETLYWCSIDLTKYYPSIKMDVLEEQIIKHCSITKDSSAARLISTLLDFKVNYENYSDDELEVMSLKEKNFHALPTGLIVGGWLANIYLLDLDKGIDQKLKSNNGIIHFRYVDDHTFVSDDFDNLLKWVHEYIVGLNTLDLSINDDKIQPAIPGINGFVFQEYLKNGREYIQSGVFRHRLLAKFKIDNTFDIQNSLNDIRKNTRIDPKYPSPLMTLTLQKVSQISHISLRLMSPNETDMIFHDLKSLISIDLPDAEIKKDTRISFASTMLSRLIVADAVDLKKIHIYRKTFIDSCNAAIQRRRQKNNKIERSKDSKNTDNGKELSDSEKYEKEIEKKGYCCIEAEYSLFDKIEKIIVGSDILEDYHIISRTDQEKKELEKGSYLCILNEKKDICAASIAVINSGIAQAEEMVVKDEYKMRGFAPILTYQRLKWLDSKNIQKIEGWILTHNESSLRYHRKLGYHFTDKYVEEWVLEKV